MKNNDVTFDFLNGIYNLARIFETVKAFKVVDEEISFNIGVSSIEAVNCEKVTYNIVLNVIDKIFVCKVD